MKSLYLMIMTAVTLLISSAASAEWNDRPHRSHGNVIELVEYAAHAYNDSRNYGGQIYYENHGYQQPRYDDRYYNHYDRRHRTYSYDRHNYRDRRHNRHSYRPHDRHHYRHHDRHHRRHH